MSENTCNICGANIADISAWCRIRFNDLSANPAYCAYNFYVNGNLVTNLIIPNNVTSIGDNAFSCCKSLTSITIPDSVTRVGECVFKRWTSSQTIYCQAARKSSGWDSDRNGDAAKVVWGA